MRAHSRRTREIVVRADEVSVFVYLTAQTWSMSAVCTDDSQGRRDRREAFGARGSSCVVLHESIVILPAAVMAERRMVRKRRLRNFGVSATKILVTETLTTKASMPEAATDELFFVFEVSAHLEAAAR